MAKRNALGKGLSALLETADTDITSVEPKALHSIAEIPVNQIEANPFQPREEFDEDALQELADSIKVHGIIQPITVRKMGYEKYELISGERRTRAAILSGLKKIPAYIRLANDQEMLEMALIENIQREQLNAIEVSLSYQRLMEECGLKLEELGERVGKKRSTVNNYLRLLKLPPNIQSAVRDGDITMGHARALINVEDEAVQRTIFLRTVNENLSVREVEELVRNDRTDGEPDRPRAEKSPFDPFYDLADQRQFLSAKFDAKVKMKAGKGDTGSIEIKFNDRDHLLTILEQLSKG
jgi:ParB family chromosome partitioning protein